MASELKWIAIKTKSNDRVRTFDQARNAVLFLQGCGWNFDAFEITVGDQPFTPRHRSHGKLEQQFRAAKEGIDTNEP